MTHLTDKQIQEHIVNNCRNAHGEPMMDEQAFYEGAKWYRKTVVKNNAVLPHVIGQSEQLKPLDADFTKALNDLTKSKVGNKPTKKRF